MAMRETVRSLRAYFVVVGLLGLYRGWELWSGPRDALVTALAVGEVVMAASFLYGGLTAPKHLRGSPGVLNAIVWANLLYALAVLGAVASRRTLAVYDYGATAVGVIICLYLLAQIKRLAAEASGKAAADAVS